MCECDECDIYIYRLKGLFRNMEKSEIIEIINFMNSIYIHKQIKPTTDMLNVWHEMIREYSKEQVISLIKDIARTKSYAPNLATLTEELGKSFILRHSVIGDNYVVFVDFDDCRFPFNFKRKEDAKNLVEYLKTGPTKDEVEYYYEEFTRNKNEFISTFRMSIKLQEEINQQAKNDYYKRNFRRK